MLPIFDTQRADRTLAEIASVAPALAQGKLRDCMAAAAGNSPYLARVMLKETEFLARYEAEGTGLLEVLNGEALRVGLEADINAAMQVLRVAKRRAALAIALADIAGVFDLQQVTNALTRFADASVKGALRFVLAEAARKAEMPETPPEPLEADSGLIVFAMGKHGAFELNYSSDIDLVVFYEEEKFPFQRAGDKRSAAVDLVKGLVKILSEPTAEGYVFRVDLRLRPDAGATQIAISAEAA